MFFSHILPNPKYRVTFFSFLSQDTKKFKIFQQKKKKNFKPPCENLNFDKLTWARYLSFKNSGVRIFKIFTKKMGPYAVILFERAMNLFWKIYV